MRQPAPDATGRRERQDGVDWLLWSREVAAPADAVWAALTEQDRLARWLGPARLDLDAGAVELAFADVGDVGPQQFDVDALGPGHEFRLATPEGPDAARWRIRLSVVDEGGRAALELALALPNHVLAPTVAAWTECYVDRFVAFVEGGRPAEPDLDAYFVTQAAHYRRLFPVQSRPDCAPWGDAT